MIKALLYGDKLAKYLQENLIFDRIDTCIGTALVVCNSENHIVYFGFENETNNPYQACKNYFPQCRLEPCKLDQKSLQDSIVKLYGTPFQQCVWQALSQIKPSTTPISYSHLAMMIGIPSAVRAVAHAVAKNPVSGLIPCHRIIYKTGKSGRYAWGDILKTKLLALEMKGQDWLSHVI